MGLRCKRCGSDAHVKNGLMRGQQRYLCKGCGLNFTDTPPRGKPLARPHAASRWHAPTRQAAGTPPRGKTPAPPPAEHPPAPPPREKPLARPHAESRWHAPTRQAAGTPPRGKPLALKVAAVLLSVSGLSMNRTAKLLGVSTPTIQAWLEQFAAAYAQKPEPEGRAVVIELDEMWPYLKQSPNRSGSGKLGTVLQGGWWTGNAGIVTKPLASA